MAGVLASQEGHGEEWANCHREVDANHRPRALPSDTHPSSVQLSLNHSNLNNHVQLALTVYELAAEAVGDAQVSSSGGHLSQCDKG